MPDPGGHPPRTAESLFLPQSGERRQAAPLPEDRSRGNETQALEDFLETCKQDLSAQRSRSDRLLLCAFGLLLAPMVLGLFVFLYLYASGVGTTWIAAMKIVLVALPSESFGLLAFGLYRSSTNDTAHLRAQYMTMSARLTQLKVARAEGDREMLAKAMGHLGAVEGNRLIAKGMSTEEQERNRRLVSAVFDGFASLRRAGRGAGKPVRSRKLRATQGR
jgi:hypothetical protein